MRVNTESKGRGKDKGDGQEEKIGESSHSISSLCKYACKLALLFPKSLTHLPVSVSQSCTRANQGCICQPMVHMPTDSAYANRQCLHVKPQPQSPLCCTRFRKYGTHNLTRIHLYLTLTPALAHSRNTTQYITTRNTTQHNTKHNTTQYNTIQHKTQHNTI